MSGALTAGGQTAMASSASRVHERVVALGGAPGYLVYAKQVSGHTLRPGFVRGPLRVLSRSGTTQRVGGRSARYFQIEGRTLVYTTRSGPRWRDLASGDHGPIPVPDGSWLASAAPHGWVTAMTDPSSGTGARALERVSTDGAVTPLGDPLPDGATFALTAGANGLVAASFNDGNGVGDGGSGGDGAVVSMRWSQPGHWRTLLAPGGNEVQCPSVSETLTACVVDRGATSHEVIFPLDGSAPTRSHGSAGCTVVPPALLRHSAAWICRQGRQAGRLFRMGIRGGITTSTRRFCPVDPVSAFGRLVVGPRSQRSLQTLNRARATPQVIVRAT